MKNGRAEGQPFRRGSIWSNIQRRAIPVGVVSKRFSGPVKHESYPDAGGEQHRHPGMCPEFRFGSRTAEPDAAERAESEIKRKSKNDDRGDREQPVGSLQSPSLGAGQIVRRGIRENEAHPSEQDNQSGAEKENRIVDVQPRDFDIVLADFVIRFVHKEYFVFGSFCFGRFSARCTLVEIMIHTRLLP